MRVYVNVCVMEFVSLYMFVSVTVCVPDVHMRGFDCV